MATKRQKLAPGSDSDPKAKASEIIITSNFDSGSIEVVDSAVTAINVNNNSAAVRLNLVAEPFTEFTDKKAHMQWFHFCVSGGQGVDVQYTIGNAKDASYAAAWPGYQVAYSHTLRESDWRRCTTTTYSPGKGLQWTFKSPHARVHFAYFAPYSLERTQTLVGYAQKHGAKVEVLGLSLEQRTIDLLKIGEGALKVWVIGRQHPGESMASWFTEGLVHHLLDEDVDVDESKSNKINLEGEEGVTFFIVPNMNPDGSVKGHLRTNALGCNLNREWAPTGTYEAPTKERSPEVYYTLARMKNEGVDVFCDVHGDEEIPDNFFAGSQGIASWSERLEALFVLFSGAMARNSRFFQCGRGYGEGGPLYLCENEPVGEANLAVAGDHVAHEFDCLSVTLEMPFKDVTTNNNDETGWCPDRCKELARDLVKSIRAVAPHVRSDTVLENTKDEVEGIKAAHSGGNNWWGPPPPANA